MTTDAPTRFRLRAGYGVRMIGAGCVLLAIAVVVWGVRSMLDHPVTTVLAVLVTALGVLIVLTGGALATAPPTLLRLEPTGLRNHTGRGVGVHLVTWTDVTNIAWSTADNGSTLVVTLADGSSSRIHAGLLNANHAEVENAIRMHADDAYGYRPL